MTIKEAQEEKKKLIKGIAGEIIATLREHAFSEIIDGGNTSRAENYGWMNYHKLVYNLSDEAPRHPDHANWELFTSALRVVKAMGRMEAKDQNRYIGKQYKYAGRDLEKAIVAGEKKRLKREATAKRLARKINKHDITLNWCGGEVHISTSAFIALAEKAGYK